MSKTKRIENFIAGVLLIIGGLILAIIPDVGYLLIDIALAVIFIVIGVRLFVYYITLARYMVEGITSFYKSIIYLDLGFFAITISDMPKHYVMIYIIIGFAFAAVMDIIEAVNLKKISSPVWKARLFQGMVCVLLPLASLVIFSDSEFTFIAYGASIIIRGLGKIADAFRRTAIVYVGE